MPFLTYEVRQARMSGSASRPHWPWPCPSA